VNGPRTSTWSPSTTTSWKYGDHLTVLEAVDGELDPARVQGEEAIEYERWAM